MNGSDLELEESITDLAVNFVVGMMRSASTEIIRPLDWWPRAKAALVVAASTAETYPAMVSRFLEKVQVSAATEPTCHVIDETRIAIDAFGETGFERFRFLCERDALYIVAMSQVANKRRKESVNAAE